MSEISKAYEPKTESEKEAKEYDEAMGGERYHPSMYKPKPSDLDKPKKQKYGSGGPFSKAWDDLTKFADCPVCLGDPRACPTPDVPASVCPTRRNAINHMKRGKGARPAIVLRD